MIPIGDILQPGQINLALAAGEKAGAIEEVLGMLRGDPRVKDFDLLLQAVETRNAPAIAENGCGICLAHGRTDSVTSLVLAVGRSTEGFSCPEVEDPVKLVFVAGIPARFNSEYLRIVGAIARICRDRHQLQHLLGAKTPERFLELLSAGEMKL